MSDAVNVFVDLHRLHSQQSSSQAAQIIYTILGIPPEDLKWLTEQNSVRTSGSSTTRGASAANQFVFPSSLVSIDGHQQHTTLPQSGERWDH